MMMFVLMTPLLLWLLTMLLLWRWWLLVLMVLLMLSWWLFLMLLMMMMMIMIMASEVEHWTFGYMCYEVDGCCCHWVTVGPVSKSPNLNLRAARPGFYKMLHHSFLSRLLMTFSSKAWEGQQQATYRRCICYSSLCFVIITKILVSKAGNALGPLLRKVSILTLRAFFVLLICTPCPWRFLAADALVIWSAWLRKSEVFIHSSHPPGTRGWRSGTILQAYHCMDKRLWNRIFDDPGTRVTRRADWSNNPRSSCHVSALKHFNWHRDWFPRPCS